MATFTALAAIGVNSDLLFPGLRGGDNWHTLTNTADTFSVQYDADGNRPGTGMVVTFHGSSFDYDGEDNPIAGAVDSITIASSFITVAKWDFATPVGSLEDYLGDGLTPEILNQLSRFNGNSGDDRLVGHGNQDEFYAGGGNDTIVLGFNSSASTINGGPGYDTIEVQASVGLNLAEVTGTEALTFNALLSDTTVSFSVGDSGYNPLPSDFHVTGDNHANSIEFHPIFATSPVSLNLSHFTFANWDSANDSVTINGANAADTLIGSRVSDHINGDLGNDLIRGGLGRDFLSGGDGSDTFDFNSIKETKKGGAHRDVISDFQRGADDIDLRGIDAQKGVGGNQKFDWIGKHDFHKEKGELHYVKHGTNVVVEGDVNGNGHADFQILVQDLHKLGAGDFLL